MDLCLGRGAGVVVNGLLHAARGAQGPREEGVDETKGARKENPSPFRGVLLSVLTSGGRHLHTRSLLFLPFSHIHPAALCLYFHF